MKSAFTRRGPLKTEFSHKGMPQGRDIDTSVLTPQATIERQVDVIISQTQRILQDIRSGREPNISLQDFQEIAESARSHLVELNQDTQEIDKAIQRARELILRRNL